MKINYAHIEFSPVMFNDKEAWFFNGNAWIVENLLDAEMNGKLMSRTEFEKVFPNLPPLPSEAFKN